MTSDNNNPMCSESDLFEIADGFHSLFLAHRERLIQLIVKWWDEHRNSTWPSPPPRLFPLPQRDLSLPEKAVCIAAIHDKVWKGELITPFPTDEFVITKDFLRKEDAARDFRQLTKHVSEITAADLRHLRRHLDSIKDWLEDREQPAHEHVRITKKALSRVLKITANTLRKRICDGEIPVHPDDLLDDKKNAKNIRVKVAWYKTQQSNTQ
jgi:hypothetical protein